MTDRIGPVGKPQTTRRAADRRGEDRRAAERRDDGPVEVIANLPVPVSPVFDHEPKAAPPPGPGAFTAQLLGQGGEKRGLRGGPPVLDGARSAYLGTEYSGPHDRRPAKGRITKTEV